MISQRDIQIFFSIIEVISNADKYKEQLTVFKNLSSGLDEREKALAEREQVVKNESNTAQAIVADQGKQRMQIEEERKAVEAQRDKNKIISNGVLDGVNRNSKKAQDLDALENDLLRQKDDLDSRDKAIVTKEQVLVIREDRLREKEADYQTRMQKLRSIV